MDSAKHKEDCFSEKKAHSASIYKASNVSEQNKCFDQCSFLSTQLLITSSFLSSLCSPREINNE